MGLAPEKAANPIMASPRVAWVQPPGDPPCRRKTTRRSPLSQEKQPGDPPCRRKSNQAIPLVAGKGHRFKCCSSKTSAALYAEVLWQDTSPEQCDCCTPESNPARAQLRAGFMCGAAHLRKGLRVDAPVDLVEDVQQQGHLRLEGPLLCARKAAAASMQPLMHEKRDARAVTRHAAPLRMQQMHWRWSNCDQVSFWPNFLLSI